MNAPEVRDAIRADLLCVLADLGDSLGDSRKLTTKGIAEALQKQWPQVSNRSVAAYLSRLHDEDFLWRPGGGWWLKGHGRAVVRMLRAKGTA